jgi:hypothetical protein
VEGTNKAHENGEAMGLVGVRLTAQLGRSLMCIDAAKGVDANNITHWDKEEPVGTLGRHSTLLIRYADPKRNISEIENNSFACHSGDRQCIIDLR